MLQQWDSEDLELAMLLDESPMHDYISVKSYGEPWRPDGPLTEAATTIDLYGYAWLIVVYISDEPHTWGTRKIKLTVGGRIARKNIINGFWNGELIPMKFEVVARDIFRNIIGENSDQPFKLLRSAQILPEPSNETRSKYEKQESDDWLGTPEIQHSTSNGVGGKLASFVPQIGLGCVLTWMNEQGYTEKWFVQDPICFEEHRFCLTEYQRRPFIHILLARLGFVKAIEAANRNEPSTIEEACAGLLNTVCQAMQALSNIASSSHYK